MILYRHMESAEEPLVRDLTRRCHPSWPPRPKFWYFANPTIVAMVDDEVIGYGSYTVDNHPAGASFIQYLRDSAVDPAYRGQGIGRALLQKRMDVGRSVGCAMFIGMTWPDNTPMRAILKSLGFHECQRVPNAFPQGDGIICINAGAHE